MLDIRVINLSTSTERWEKIKQRLIALQIPFTRFDAIDGRINFHPLFNKYNDKKRATYRSRALSGGELGCFASHYLLWEQCVASNKPLVILEDDILIEDNLRDALTFCEQHINELEYIRLSGIFIPQKNIKKLNQVGNYTVYRHRRGPAGTQAYVLHPKAAKKFLQHADCWYMAVDDYMDRYWTNRVDNISIMPYPIVHADVATDMNRLNKEKGKRIQACQREWRRFTDKLQRCLYRTKKQSYIKNMSIQ